jgi:integrase
LRKRLLREPPGRLRWLSGEEEARLLAACRPALRRLLTVAVNTGCRAGELRALKWGDVNQELRIVRVEQSKSGQRREVPLNATAEAAIGERPAGATDADAVFLSEHGRPWLERNLCARVESAVKRAGLAGVTAHTMRHTAASRIVQRTGSLIAVRDLLGHSSLAMAARYSHLAPGHLRDAVDALTPPAPGQEPEHDELEGKQASKPAK